MKFNTKRLSKASESVLFDREKDLLYDSCISSVADIFDYRIDLV